VALGFTTKLPFVWFTI